MRTRQTQLTNTSGLMRIALIVGVVAAVLAVVGLLISGPGVFFQAYLFSYLFWLGISLGLLAWVLLHFTVSSRWGLTIRRIGEAGGASIWIMAILFIPLIFGLPFLYPWARPAEVAASSLLQNKQWYLNVPFWIIRAVIYFALWILFAYLMNRQIRRLGDTPAGDLVVRGRLQGLGAVGLIIYSITMYYAAVDWLMSLQPEWYSTVFGMVIVMAQVQSALAFAILVLNLFPGLSLGLLRRWNYATSPVPYQDLGALSMTLTMAFAYVAFFQMLIQWAGNIPREVFWYVQRTQAGWAYVADFIGLFQFIIPFCALLTIRVRHNMRRLAVISAILFVANLVSMFWHVKPAFYPNGFAISLIDIVMPFAIGGLWVAGFLYMLARRPALTLDDQETLHLTEEEPRLDEAT